jgi:hypothetical protein
MTPLEVAAMLVKKLADYPKGSRIEATWWRGPDMFDLTPPHEKEERLFAEFRIRPPRKKRG